MKENPVAMAADVQDDEWRQIMDELMVCLVSAQYLLIYQKMNQTHFSKTHFILRRPGKKT